MGKRNWLEKQVAKNKEALLKNKLALQKTAAHLSVFHRKRRKNFLPNYDNLFKKAGLVDADTD